jgi:hypothetical protein
MSWSALVAAFTDPYERKARVFPGLLVALPLLVPLICVYGAKNPTLTAVIGLLGGCGAIYGLASIARGRGKDVEDRLISEWGGMPTTVMLRHRDTRLGSATREQYHALIQAKLGISLPSLDEERANPAAADDKYKNAVQQLIWATRAKSFSLLLKENIAYGFHRNMRGVRSLGWITSTIGLAIGVAMSGALTFDPLHFQPLMFSHLSISAGLTLGVAISLWFAWFHFSDQAVKRISHVYADRLFECLRALPKKATARSKLAAEAIDGNPVN